MGGSTSSAYYMPEEEMDTSDPDSDIPGELQVILAGQLDGDNAVSYRTSISYNPYELQFQAITPLSFGLTPIEDRPTCFLHSLLSWLLLC